MRCEARPLKAEKIQSKHTWIVKSDFTQIELVTGARQNKRFCITQVSLNDPILTNKSHPKSYIKELKFKLLQIQQRKPLEGKGVIKKNPPLFYKDGWRSNERYGYGNIVHPCFIGKSNVKTESYSERKVQIMISIQKNQGSLPIKMVFFFSILPHPNTSMKLLFTEM